MPGLEHMIGYAIAARVRRGAVVFAFVVAWLAFVTVAAATAVALAAILGFRAPSIRPFVPLLIPAGIYAAVRVRASLSRLLRGPWELTRT